MLHVIAIIFWSAVFLAAFGILFGHLRTLLRSDRHGSMPPPRSHHDEADDRILR